MITGVIAEGLKPELSLIVRGPSGIEHSVNARIDTGFDDYVLLPQSVVDELQLPFLMRTPIDLADGSQRYLNYHGATVLWNGQERKLPVLATPSENALIGMALLENHEVCLTVTQGGTIIVRPLV